MKNKETFYLNLRKKIFNWVESKGFKNRKLVNYILLAPDFFYLLWKLSLDPDIPGDDRLLLGVTLIYFISPFDFFPEGIFGPLGYLDDIAISAYVIKKVMDRAGEDKVKQYWPGEEDLVLTIEKVISKVDEYIGSGLWKKLVKFIENKAEEQKKSSGQTKNESKRKRTVKKKTIKKQKEAK